MLGEIDDLRATPSPPPTQVTSADLINNNNSLGGVVSQHLQQQWLLGMQVRIFFKENSINRLYVSRGNVAYR